MHNSSTIEPLPCTTAPLYSHCHAQQLRYTATVMHNSSSIQPLSCTTAPLYSHCHAQQLQYTATVMHNSSNIQPLPCTTAPLYSHCHAQQLQYRATAMHNSSTIQPLPCTTAPIYSHCHAQQLPCYTLPLPHRTAPIYIATVSTGLIEQLQCTATAMHNSSAIQRKPLPRTWQLQFCHWFNEIPVHHTSSKMLYLFVPKATGLTQEAPIYSHCHAQQGSNIQPLPPFCCTTAPKYTAIATHKAKLQYTATVMHQQLQYTSHPWLLYVPQQLQYHIKPIPKCCTFLFQKYRV